MRVKEEFEFEVTGEPGVTCSWRSRAMAAVTAKIKFVNGEFSRATIFGKLRLKSGGLGVETYDINYYGPSGMPEWLKPYMDYATASGAAGIRTRVTDALNKTLGDQEAMYCVRDWSAWGYGTMQADDFINVVDSDAMGEIIDAVMAAIMPPAAGTEG